MLPKEINIIIQKNLRKILNDIPADDILTELLADGVISEYEVSKIKRIPDDKDKNFELLQILKRRGQSDFYKFCNALKLHETNNVQELGTFLENEANKALNINITTNLT